MMLKRRKLLVIFLLPAIVLLFIVGWSLKWIEEVKQ